jgi:hypothetical protein
MEKFGGQLYQHIIMAFAPISFRQKKEPNLQAQKNFAKNFHTKKLLVKCW